MRCLLYLNCINIILRLFLFYSVILVISKVTVFFTNCAFAKTTDELSTSTSTPSTVLHFCSRNELPPSGEKRHSLFSCTTLLKPRALCASQQGRCPLFLSAQDSLTCLEIKGSPKDKLSAAQKYLRPMAEGRIPEAPQCRWNPAEAVFLLLLLLLLV